MAPVRCHCTLLFLLGALRLILLPSPVTSRSIPALRLPREFPPGDDVYCESWKFSSEVDNAGNWERYPPSCEEFVAYYMTGVRYASDSELVATYSFDFAREVPIVNDGKDAWIFDIDETLLSNSPFYALHRYGAEPFNERKFDEWADLGTAPALPASLNLYNELKGRGFKLILLTGRDDRKRTITVKNLLSEGYSGWERLIMRGPADRGKLAWVFKSEKRLELVKEGYRLHGNSGDQWSDLRGFAEAARSFKLPNPMYYIP